MNADRKQLRNYASQLTSEVRAPYVQLRNGQLKTPVTIL